jgi:hypothetical protein
VVTTARREHGASPDLSSTALVSSTTRPAAGLNLAWSRRRKPRLGHLIWTLPVPGKMPRGWLVSLSPAPGKKAANALDLLVTGDGDDRRGVGKEGWPRIMAAPGLPQRSKRERERL